MNDDKKELIEGLWLTGAKDAHVHVWIGEDDRAYGKVAWMERDANKDGSKPRVDELNPKKDLRSRTLEGLVILDGFQYKGDGEWEEGKVYDPDTGNTYSGTIKNNGPNVLKMHGYVGIKLFGRSENWIRIDD
ncbi:DUF2147 domain-containing protein [Limibacter armeniacum]|uniref:DUF2147 domain-containing protein n=1 Tax=Limibacter armeniacum TaxID=466084 RepID=UPI002FE665EA